MGQTSEESRGIQDTRTNAGVHGGWGVVEIVCESVKVINKGTVDGPIFRFVKQDPSRQ